MPAGEGAQATLTAPARPIRWRGGTVCGEQTTERTAGTAAEPDVGSHFSRSVRGPKCKPGAGRVGMKVYFWMTQWP